MFGYGGRRCSDEYVKEELLLKIRIVGSSGGVKRRVKHRGRIHTKRT